MVVEQNLAFEVRRAAVMVVGFCPWRAVPEEGFVRLEAEACLEKVSILYAVSGLDDISFPFRSLNFRGFFDDGWVRSNGAQARFALVVAKDLLFIDGFVSSSYIRMTVSMKRMNLTYHCCRCTPSMPN